MLFGDLSFVLHFTIPLFFFFFACYHTHMQNLQKVNNIRFQSFTEIRFLKDSCQKERFPHPTATFPVKIFRTSSKYSESTSLHNSTRIALMNTIHMDGEAKDSWEGGGNWLISYSADCKAHEYWAPTCNCHDGAITGSSFLNLSVWNWLI